MSAQSRWLRINIDWDDSDWVAELAMGSQLAWIKLLCHVKKEGSAGRAKALSASRAAQKWGVSVADVSALLEAAFRDNAVLVEEGLWVVVKWAVYQPSDRTNAERQRRHRDRSQGELNLDTDVTLDVTALSRRVTRTETGTVPPLEDSPSTVTKVAASPRFNKPGFDRWFETKFKPAYPARLGDFEYPEAKRKLEALFRSGKAEKGLILEGLARYSASVDREGIRGTRLVKQASTWVNKRGWETEYGGGRSSAGGSFAQETSDLVRRAQEHFNAA